MYIYMMQTMNVINYCDTVQLTLDMNRIKDVHVLPLIRRLEAGGKYLGIVFEK